MSNAVDDWYSILQVHESAEPEVIEAAYRRLARKYHPDVNTSPNATETMQRLNDAYAVLSDPGKRSAYDDRRRVGRWAERERQEPAMSSREDKSIELSKGAISTLTCGAIAFVAVGVWMMFALNGNPLLRLLLFGTIIVFFGFLGVGGLRMLLSTSPGLVLNRHGFIDNSSLVSAGFVPWSEVVEIEQDPMFLYIHVKHPQQYVGRGNVMQKIMRLVTWKMYGAPIAISANLLRVNHADLVAKFEEYSAQGHSGS